MGCHPLWKPPPQPKKDMFCSGGTYLFIGCRQRTVKMKTSLLFIHPLRRHARHYSCKVSNLPRSLHTNKTQFIIAISAFSGYNQCKNFDLQKIISAAGKLRHLMKGRYIIWQEN